MCWFLGTGARPAAAWKRKSVITPPLSATRNHWNWNVPKPPMPSILPVLMLAKKGVSVGATKLWPRAPKTIWPDAVVGNAVGWVAPKRLIGAYGAFVASQ